ncbi:MAG: hypothetical protein JKY24_04475 [Pseudomonadales bacterium]|nr:hypothetical protein [Pseudomonadales bacterium]
MKFREVVVLTALAAALAACGGPEIEDTSSGCDLVDTTVTTELEGSWTSSCVTQSEGIYRKSSYLFVGNQWSLRITTFGDEECTELYDDGGDEGGDTDNVVSVSGGSGGGGVFTVGDSITTVTGGLSAEEINFSLVNLCEITDSFFTIYRLDNNGLLTLGDETSLLDTSTEENRPVDLNENIIYTKQ